MPLITEYRCGVCGAQRRVSWGGICLSTDSRGRECLAEIWEHAPPKADPNDPFYVTTLLDAPDALTAEQFDAPLSQAFGGIVRGYTMIVGGGEGVGKSTLCAQLASEMTRRRGLIFWCDADQGGDPKLINACFSHTRSPVDAVRIVARRPETANLATAADLLKKLAGVTTSIDVCIFDSLQKWAPNQPGQFVEALRTLNATSFVIARNNAEGKLYGATDPAYDCDAVAIVSDGIINVPNKCRWKKTPRSAPWVKTESP